MRFGHTSTCPCHAHIDVAVRNAFRLFANHAREKVTSLERQISRFVFFVDEHASGGQAAVRCCMIAHIRWESNEIIDQQKMECACLLAA